MGVEQRFSVFDAGAATAQTVEFFSQFKCRLHFADLYDDALINEQEGISEEELSARFSELLSFAAEPFDLCLLWDLVAAALVSVPVAAIAALQYAAEMAGFEGY